MKCLNREERTVLKKEMDDQKCKCGNRMDRLVSSSKLGDTGTEFNNKKAIPDD